MRALVVEGLFIYFNFLFKCLNVIFHIKLFLGINKSHLQLHAKNFAIAAGVPPFLVENAVNYMKMSGNISKAAAI